MLLSCIDSSVSYYIMLMMLMTGVAQLQETVSEMTVDDKVINVILSSDAHVVS